MANEDMRVLLMIDGNIELRVDLSDMVINHNNQIISIPRGNSILISIDAKLLESIKFGKEKISYSKYNDIEKFFAEIYQTYLNLLGTDSETLEQRFKTIF